MSVSHLSLVLIITLSPQTVFFLAFQYALYFFVGSWSYHNVYQKLR